MFFSTFLIFKSIYSVDNSSIGGTSIFMDLNYELESLQHEYKIQLRNVITLPRVTLTMQITGAVMKLKTKGHCTSSSSEKRDWAIKTWLQDRDLRPDRPDQGWVLSSILRLFRLLSFEICFLLSRKCKASCTWVQHNKTRWRMAHGASVRFSWWAERDRETVVPVHYSFPYVSCCLPSISSLSSSIQSYCDSSPGMPLITVHCEIKAFFHWREQTSPNRGLVFHLLKKSRICLP